ncbi:MAG: glycosyltransferase family 4 protein [Lachnospiraceae bacterium]|nr:glycosyltransferase family 4 protein [Lachnospiraceae bacterium]
MKRALIITSIGGFLPQFLMSDVRSLQALGYEVHYASNFHNPVYHFSKEALTEAGIILHHIPLRKSPLRVISNCRALRCLIRLIRQERIDLVHCHNPMGGALGRVAAAMSGARPTVLYTAHGFHFFHGAPLWYWGVFYPAERLLAKQTDILITINREDAAWAQHLPLRQGGRIYMIHGVGVDAARFCGRPADRERMRTELRIPDGAFHLVNAAELNDNKNQRVILEALALLKDPDIRLSICGRGKNRQLLEEMIDRLELADQVRLLGYRTDMENVLQSADCFIFPSRREGFGIAAVEALLTGIPVIASDNRGTREYMVDGYNGLVCPPWDAAAFAAQIRRMKEDTAFRQRCAEAARQSAAPFTTENRAETMRAVYAAIDT